MNKQQIIEFAHNHAPHLEISRLEASYDVISYKAQNMTDDEIAAEIATLNEAAEQSYNLVKCWNPDMWDKVDTNRTHKYYGDACVVLAAIWVAVPNK